MAQETGATRNATPLVSVVIRLASVATEGKVHEEQEAQEETQENQREAK